MDSLWKNEGAKVSFPNAIFSLASSFDPPEGTREPEVLSTPMKIILAMKLIWSNAKNYQNW